MFIDIKDYNLEGHTKIFRSHYIIALSCNYYYYYYYILPGFSII